MRRPFPNTSFFQIVLSAVLVACGGTTPNPDEPTTGTLVVEIAAPPMSTPEVTVTGPGGFERRLSSSTTLTELAPGEYRFSATELRTPGNRFDVRQLPTVSPGVLNLQPGASAPVRVTYSAEPIVDGRLFAIDYGNNTLQIFDEQGLETSGMAAPRATLEGDLPALFPFPLAMVRGPDGDFWIASCSRENALVRLTPQAMVAGALASAKVKMSGAAGGALDCPSALAFDPDGNLWVANGLLGSSSIVKLDSGSLATSGTPTASLTITAVVNPSSLAFDGDGNLWVALDPDTGTDSVVMFTRQALSSTPGAPTAAISLTGALIDGPSGLAFDGSDLWVSNSGNSRVLRYTAAQRAASGSPTPDRVLYNADLGAAGAIVFDAERNLWVSDNTRTSLQVYTAQEREAGSGGPRSVRTTVDARALAFEGAMLWVLQANPARVIRLSASQVSGSGVKDETELEVSLTNIPRLFKGTLSVAVDAEGHPWVSHCTAGTLMRFNVPTGFNEKTQLLPHVTLVVGTGTCPGGLAFDRFGTLWVTLQRNDGDGRVLGFRADQLHESGRPQPAFVLSGPATAPWDYPYVLAFDREGSLWVGTGAEHAQLIKLTSDQLESSGEKIASVTIAGSEDNRLEPYALAFDREGSLWVANCNTELPGLVRISPAQLGLSTTSLEAATTLRHPTWLGCAEGLAFDSAGGLWVGNSDRALVRLDPTQLAQSGEVTPSLIIEPPLEGRFSALAFSPSPSALPLR